MGRQHPLVSSHARAAHHQRQRFRLSQRVGQVATVLHRQPATGGERRPRITDGNRVRLRRQVPAEVPDALYLCDWSYGKLYALHMEPKGASYTGQLEEFVAGTPLALTDIVINKKDGAMYFLVGGRRTQSGLYRVTYKPDEPDVPVGTLNAPAPIKAREIRHMLETLHGHADPKTVDTAWPFLGHEDRFIRWAARVAIEFQDPATWRERALGESANPEAALEALLALTHVSAKDAAHRAEGDPQPDPAVRDKILAALAQIDYAKLDHAQTLDLLRLYEVVLHRFGRPDPAGTAALVARLDPHYPAKSRELNAELAQLLVFLEAPDAARKTVALLDQAPTQEEQLDYAKALRVLKTGWTPDVRKAYANWFVKAANYKGGNSFRGFINNIRRDALANMSEAERAELAPLIETKPTEGQRRRRWRIDHLSRIGPSMIWCPRFLRRR